MDAALKEKPWIDLRQILERSSLALSIIGFIQNCLLLYLILFKTNAKLKDYQKILLQNCLVDIIYNISNGITRTQTDFKDGNFFLIMTNAFGNIQSPYRNLLICSWVFSLFYCVSSLPVQFLYRYFLIVKEIRLNGKRYAAMLFISFISAFGYACSSFYVLWPPPEIYKQKAKLLLSDIYYFNNDNLTFITGDIRGGLAPVLLAIYASLLINISYCIIIWSSYKVWKHMKRMEIHMSLQTRDIHHQMTKALIIQALIPFIVCFFPIGITIAMILLHANVSGLGIIVSLLLSWIPIVNSITTIFVVKSYRRIVFHFFECCFITKTNVLAPTNLSYTASAVEAENVDNKISQT